MIPMIRTTEEFEGCFAENVNEQDASLDLLRTSPLVLNLIKRNYEVDFTEAEKKNIEKKTEGWSSANASALSQLRDEKKLDGFYSPTSMNIKWEEMNPIGDETGPRCAVVPGFVCA